MNGDVSLAGERCVECRGFGAVLCRACAGKLAPASAVSLPDVDRVVAAYDYSGAVRNLVLGLKLRGHRSCAEPLVAGLRSEVMRRGLIAGTIAWVPGRTRDIRSRGFDHAQVLATKLARDLGLPLADALFRVTGSRDQSGLSRAERHANIAGAFAARRVPSEIALVDDLVTTGATANACARALRSAGAERVELVAAARA